MTTDLRKAAIIEIAEVLYDSLESERVTINSGENAHAVAAAHVTDLWRANFKAGIRDRKQAQAEALACLALTGLMGLIDLGLIAYAPTKGGPADAG